jgi:Flp pilus assembly protein TadB
VIGAVFAMISALFCIMVTLVGSAAAGREIHDELDRIRRGERPAEDEVRNQWNEITAEARSRWDTLRAQIQQRRRRRDRTRGDGGSRSVHEGFEEDDRAAEGHGDEGRHDRPGQPRS